MGKNCICAKGNWESLSCPEHGLETQSLKQKGLNVNEIIDALSKYYGVEPSNLKGNENFAREIHERFGYCPDDLAKKIGLQTLDKNGFTLAFQST